MKKLACKALPIVLLTTLSLTACHRENTVTGNGSKQTTTRTVASFQNVELNGSFQVVIVGQMPQHLALTADSNLLPYYTTTVKDNTLIIDTAKDVNPKPTQAPVVEISVPNLQAININGAATLNATQLAGDKLAVTVRGTGKGNISATTKEEYIKVEGSGNLTLGGQTNKAALKVEGAGKINGQGLSANDVNVDVSGAGYVSVTARQSIDVKVEGTGLVEYYGNPSKITQSISGVGKVIGISSNEAKSSS